MRVHSIQELNGTITEKMKIHNQKQLPVKNWYDITRQKPDYSGCNPRQARQISLQNSTLR